MVCTLHLFSLPNIRFIPLRRQQAHGQWSSENCNGIHHSFSFLGNGSQAGLTLEVLSGTSGCRITFVSVRHERRTHQRSCLFCMFYVSIFTMFVFFFFFLVYIWISFCCWVLCLLNLMILFLTTITGGAGEDIFCKARRV